MSRTTFILPNAQGSFLCQVAWTRRDDSLTRKESLHLGNWRREGKRSVRSLSKAGILKIKQRDRIAKEKKATGRKSGSRLLASGCLRPFNVPTDRRQRAGDSATGPISTTAVTAGTVRCSVSNACSRVEAPNRGWVLLRFGTCDQNVALQQRKTSIPAVCL
jgi:hypothetical protein